MVLINFDGKHIFATPKTRFPDGHWLMVANDHHPRFSIGTDILVAAADVISPTADELTHIFLASQPAVTTENADMPAEVDSLTALIKAATDIKGVAMKTAARFQGSLESLNEALGYANEVSSQFEKSAAELRGALGLHGNNPPPGPLSS